MDNGEETPVDVQTSDATDFASKYIGRSSQEQADIVDQAEDTRSDEQRARDAKKAEFGSADKHVTPYSPLVFRNPSADVINKSAKEGWIIDDTRHRPRAPKTKYVAPAPQPQVRPEYDPKLNLTTPLTQEQRATMRDRLDDQKIAIENQKIVAEQNKRLKLKRLLQRAPIAEIPLEEQAV